MRKKSLHLTLTEEEKNKLDDIATLWGVSQNAVIRILIRDFDKEVVGKSQEELPSFYQLSKRNKQEEELVG
jgi:transcriptional antiterminator